MNDLSGLSWNSSGNVSSAKQSQQTTPLSTQQSSGRSTPLSSLPSARPSQQPQKDTFAGLLGAPNKTTTTATSLQERQKQLLAEKERQQSGIFSNGDSAFWDTLGSGSSSGRATPNAFAIPPPPGSAQASQLQQQSYSQTEPDLFAAFSANAPVDRASHFPPPPSSSQSDSRPQSTSRPQSNGLAPRDVAISVSRQASPLSAVTAAPVHTIDNDEDDPFGLKEFEKKQSRTPAPQRQAVSHQEAATTDDDDILGDLGRPPPPPQPPQQSSGPTRQVSATDRAVAELVDMGFAPEQAKVALAATDSGTDVQAAVGILLTQAHKATGSRPLDRPGDRPARTENHRERDVQQVAQEYGAAFLKSANSFWKSSQKKVQKAVADFQQGQNQNQDATDTMPKWMRDAQSQSRNDERGGKVTDEAAMLDGERRKPSRPVKPEQPSLRQAASREWDDDVGTSRSRPSQPVAPRDRLARQLKEEDQQTYISPARRRKPPTAEVPQPISQLQTESQHGPSSQNARPSIQSRTQTPALEEMDIFSDKLPDPIVRPAASVAAANALSQRPLRTAAIPVRAKITTRTTPAVSEQTLAASGAQRAKGSEAFKRGDFAEAQACYSAALSGLPDSHPLLAVIRCNRALTLLKTGDPKAAIVDADLVLDFIGPSKGEGEEIEMGDGQTSKPMKEFFGKAMLRKAEALEHMEKWSDALKVWQEAIEANVGGAVAVQGRTRCEKALRPASSTPSGASTRRAPAPSSIATAKVPAQVATTTHGRDSEAVKRLRAANAAAAAASDEQFALSDTVSARLDAWKAGKSDNLRALLASLDTVLWASAGWNKVGMADLVLPNRVKVIYMKAIAKVHPDKISQAATTEQKMISAAVFATLNEAWDKFKRDNNL